MPVRGCMGTRVLLWAWQGTWFAGCRGRRPHSPAAESDWCGKLATFINYFSRCSIVEEVQRLLAGRRTQLVYLVQYACEVVLS